MGGRHRNASCVRVCVCVSENSHRMAAGLTALRVVASAMHLPALCFPCRLGPAAWLEKSRDLFGQDGHKGLVQALQDTAVPMHVLLVNTCCHLGVLHSPQGCVLAEIKFKAAQAWAAFSQGRTKTFKARGASVSRRACILRPFILPKLLYGAGWPQLQKQEMRAFGSIVWGMYHAICGFPAQESQRIGSYTVLDLSAFRRGDHWILRQKPSAFWVSHAQMPPVPVLGSFANPTDLPSDPDTSAGLLQALHGVSECDEHTVWEVVSDFIEPFSVLLATVKLWRKETSGDELVAESVLLPLDPDLIGEVDPQESGKAAKLSLTTGQLPDWPPLSAFRLNACSEASCLDLAAPPPIRRSTIEATSTCLRFGHAFGAWLEQACATIARGIVVSREEGCSFRICCPDLGPSLGPAKDWLFAAGYHVEPCGLRSAETCFTRIHRRASTLTLTRRMKNKFCRRFAGLQLPSQENWWW